VLAGAAAVAAVEDPALVEDDRLQQPVLADVDDELPELGAVDREQREQGGGGEVLELGGRRGGLVGRWVGGGLHTQYFGFGAGYYRSSATDGSVAGQAALDGPLRERGRLG
jgi:hypothetical protein